MAYNPMSSKANGDSVNVTMWNTIVDNFKAGVPDIFENAGDMVIALASKSGDRLPIGDAGAYLFADPDASPAAVWSRDGVCVAAAAGSTVNLTVGAWTAFTVYTAPVLDPQNGLTSAGSFTIPHSGVYFVHLATQWDSTSSYGPPAAPWYCLLGLFKNGSFWRAFSKTPHVQPSYSSYTAKGSAVFRFTKGDVITPAYYLLTPASSNRLYPAQAHIFVVSELV